MTEIALVKHRYAGLKRLEPTEWVSGISKRVWSRLSKEEVRLLEQMIKSPVQFVDSPVFHNGSLADELQEGFEQAENDVPNTQAKFMPGGMLDESDKATRPFRPLTRQQEIQLFLKLNYARYRVYRLFRRHGKRPLRLKPARELLKWKRNELKVRAQLAEANIPLIMTMAKRAQPTQVDIGDLTSEAGMSLLHSIDKFDCGRQIKFSTYACRAILNGISKLGTRAGRYRQCFPVQFDPDLEVAESSQTRRADIKPDLLDRIHHMLSNGLEELNDLERMILQQRFAINEDGTETRPMTLNEVGRIVGLTKERVRQIQNTALTKLRTVLEKHALAC